MAYWDKKSRRREVAIRTALLDLEKKQFAGRVGEVNGYKCEDCGNVDVTIKLAPGVTPFIVHCSKCHGASRSLFYKVPEGSEPTIGWYRPTAEEALKLDKDVLDHVLRGGLLPRVLPEGWAAERKRRFERNVRALSGDETAKIDELFALFTEGGE